MSVANLNELGRLGLLPLSDMDGTLIFEKYSTAVDGNYVTFDIATQITQDTTSSAKSMLDTVCLSCTDDQQRSDLICALENLVNTFSPTTIDRLQFPSQLKTKGRPKGTKGARLPSAFERVEQQEKSTTTEGTPPSQKKSHRQKYDEDEIWPTQTHKKQRLT
ncbi:hypothetical protein BX666DRAFT_2022137 [Dichotomocladium elegans]|nr:hypothetical protein BX666DRAFT_2022137 [Dichotomocladium elegans]